MESNNFIFSIIDDDISPGGRFYGKKIHTRFPPEPNGYLHLGHAKAIYINFLVAEKYGGLCNLRMDDTNPSKEGTEFVEAIKRDVKWLGYDWGDRFYFASDYFDEMYEKAVLLIKKGIAYVCDLTPEETKKLRGDLKTPAQSPFRNRSIDENLDLFEKMKLGNFADGSHTLRAKIDLSSGNFNMRDPVLYRIMKKSHPRTLDKWNIYPMYDFAHPIEDSIEGITHSLCSLEFEDHRPLYNWIIENIDSKNKPRRIEFARLNMECVDLSKRKLKMLVEKKIACGWDDPCMPTISGLKNRGYTPSSIRAFCERIGISKSISTIEYKVLENCLKEELEKTAPRIIAILDPLKLIVENYPSNKEEFFEIENNPHDKSQGKRFIKFSRELFIERSDFMEDPSEKFYRLYVGSTVRLKSAYCITCIRFSKNSDGKIDTVFCEYHEETAGGKNFNGKRVKSTIHWLSTKNYETLKVTCFNGNEPATNSLEMMIERNWNRSITHFQAIRLGYIVTSHVNERAIFLNSL